MAGSVFYGNLAEVTVSIIKIHRTGIYNSVCRKRAGGHGITFSFPDIKGTCNRNFAGTYIFKSFCYQ